MRAQGTRYQRRRPETEQVAVSAERYETMVLLGERRHLLARGQR